MLKSVAAVGGGSAKVARAKPATIKLKINASDKTSGVEAMQITSKKAKTGEWLPYKAKAQYKTSIEGVCPCPRRSRQRHWVGTRTRYLTW